MGRPATRVRSPSTWRYGVGTKKRVYEANGAAEVWLVGKVPNTVLVYRRSSAGAEAFDVELGLGAGEQLRAPLLPGLAIDPAGLSDR